MECLGLGRYRGDWQEAYDELSCMYRHCLWLFVISLLFVTSRSCAEFNMALVHAQLGNTNYSACHDNANLTCAIFSAVQNLVCPWYTSSWALEQLGLAYQEAAELLAGMVCDLYVDTHGLIEQQQQLAAAAAAAAGGKDLGRDDGGQNATSDSGHELPRRLTMLNAGVLRAQQQLVQQQQQQQQQQHVSGAEAAHDPNNTTAETAAAEAAGAAPAAVEVQRTSRAVRFELSNMSSTSLYTPSFVHTSTAGQQQQQQQQQHYEDNNNSSSAPYLSSKSSPNFNSTRAAALTLEEYAATKQVTHRLQQQLQQRRQLRLQAAGPAAAAAAGGAAAAAGAAAAGAASASHPLALQLRLLRPLVQVGCLCSCLPLVVDCFLG
jgi:hypothetical protein